MSKEINRSFERTLYHVRFQNGGVGIHGYATLESAMNNALAVQSDLALTHGFRPKFSIVKRTVLTREEITEETVWGK